MKKKIREEFIDNESYKKEIQKAYDELFKIFTKKPIPFFTKNEA